MPTIIMPTYPTYTATMISRRINAQRKARGGYGPRGFVQADGTLRVVAQSVAHGHIAYDRAAAYERLAMVTYEVRVGKTIVTVNH